MQLTAAGAVHQGPLPKNSTVRTPTTASIACEKSVKIQVCYEQVCELMSTHRTQQRVNRNSDPGGVVRANNPPSGHCTALPPAVRQSKHSQIYIFLKVISSNGHR